MSTVSTRLPLAESHPQIAAEWHPSKNGDLTAQQISKGSNRKVWWQHPSPTGGTPHEWEMRVDHRTSPTRPQSCSICSGKSVQQGVNDLATTHPQLAAEWHPTKNSPLRPTEVSAGSSKKHGKVWWQHNNPNGGTPHEWEGSVHHRAIQGDGCAVCRGHQVQVGVNDLATTHPQLVAEWHPTRNGTLTPQQVTHATKRFGRVWWQKQCIPGEPPHEWEARIADRSGPNQHGCAVCRGFQPAAK